MDTDTTFIAGDWGTSHLRLFLCGGTQVLERRDGPGVGELSANSQPQAHARRFAVALSAAIAPWVRTHGPMHVWLAGMVGSRNGWQEAPYVPCPFDTRTVAASLLRLDANGTQVSIIPGARCVNPRGAPDVMRGEETQIIGALRLDERLARGRHVVALPGTHTKWALLNDGTLESFQTSFSGELFALLRDHSMLARAAVTAAESSAPATGTNLGFERGIARSRELHGVPLSHLLFEVRSRQLMEGLPHPEALGFLSALIIDQDIQGAQDLFGGQPLITVIGAAALTSLYEVALAARGIHARTLDARDATIAGIDALKREKIAAPTC
jgi:2-dehydro-3-deoxygalactonokinase